MKSITLSFPHQIFRLIALHDRQCLPFTLNHSLISNSLCMSAHDIFVSDISFNYEAAVCGGIPIIHSLHSDFLADRITKIRGIMNGTVKYIFVRVRVCGCVTVYVWMYASEFVIRIICVCVRLLVCTCTCVYMYEHMTG